MNSELAICYTWAAKGVTSIDQLKDHKLTLGDTSKNSGGYIYTSMMRTLYPNNFRTVLGYATTGDIWLAIERGEVDGNCTVLSSVQTQRPEWLAQKKINVLVQFGEAKHQDLPNVPTIFELIKDENQKKAIAFLTAAEAIGRPVIGPPDMQTDRTAALRQAFLDTMKDPEFLAFAKKAKMDIDVVSADKAAAIAKAIQNTPKEAVEVARKFMD
jgi:tripartite-type tricarboxylate transporter receptor subunit TctC